MKTVKKAKKTRRTKQSRNKALILLCAILAISIFLLSVCIVIDSGRGKSVDDDIPFENGSIRTSRINGEISSEPPDISKSEAGKKDREKKSRGRIVRSDSGLLVINDDSSLENNSNNGTDEVDAAVVRSSGVPVSIESETYYYDSDEPVDEADAERAMSAARALAAATTADPDGVLPDGFLPTPGTAGRLVFVFDDAGHNLSQLQSFLELPFPITIAVLPGLEYSVQAAQKAREAGKEVILHQPMQAQNLNVEPGPKAITPDMSEQDVRLLVHQNLMEIGPVSGVNNHEGSLITANNELLGCVFDVCRAERIYFLDSRTTSESVARVEAAKRNMKIWERSVFLDNSSKKEDMITAVRLGMELATKNGTAIMIGHVWSDLLPEVLVELYPEMLMLGYSVTTISQL